MAARWLRSVWLELALVLVFVLLSACSRQRPGVLFGLVVSAVVLLFLFFKTRPSWQRVVVVFGLVRVPFLLTEPLLSDDFYRFNWDALVVNNGMSPYAILPSELVNFNSDFTRLFPLLNSPNYYSVYPPVMQMLFQLALLVPGLQFVYSLKLIYFLCEFFLFVYVSKNLLQLKWNSYKFYFISMLPLVVVEGVGNLHFEVLMMYLFFAAFVVYSKVPQKMYFSSSVLALSVLTKLTVAPLYVLFVGRLSKTIKFTIAFCVVAMAISAPFLVGEAENAFNSLALYFNSFEFNASVYYLVRYIGFRVLGYNPIASYGTVFKLVLFLLGSAIFVKAMVHKGQNPSRLIIGVNVFFLVYCLANPTLHPWYIIVPLFLSVFTHSWFWIGWSVFIYLSYNFYIDYSQVAWWLYLEYALLAIFAVLSYKWLSKKWNYALFDHG